MMRKNKKMSKTWEKALGKARQANGLPREAEPKLAKRELKGVPFGRHATATAGETVTPQRKKRVRDDSPTLRDIVRAAEAEGATVEFSLERRCRLADPHYEISPGRYVYVEPIAGAEKIFDVKGVRVAIMRNADGELIVQLTSKGKVIGTAFVIDHFQITMR
jgi:hypothetical protein